MDVEKQRKRWREKKKRYRSRKRERGLCVVEGCNNLAGEGHYYCEKHREVKRMELKKYREKWREEGRCVSCGSKLNEIEIALGWHLCDLCFQNNIESAKRQRDRKRRR